MCNVNGCENKACGWSETDTHILFVYNLGENVDEAKLVTFPRLEFVTMEVTTDESRGLESSRNKKYKRLYQIPSQTSQNLTLTWYNPVCMKFN